MNGEFVDAEVWPEGSLEVLSRLEADQLKSGGTGGLYPLLRRCMLAVLNARFGTDFKPADFEHVAFWDPGRSWIEMRLRAVRAIGASMPGDDRRFELEVGDEIRTEISCKFTRTSFAQQLVGTGLELDAWWSDPEDLFALALVRRRAKNGDGTG